MKNYDYVVITADLEIYKIIVAILFYQPALLSYIVALIGRMHMLMDFISALGTLLKASGLYEILKGTFGSIDQMMEGKKCPHNVRALRMLGSSQTYYQERPDISTMEELETALQTRLAEQDE